MAESVAGQTGSQQPVVSHEKGLGEDIQDSRGIMQAPVALIGQQKVVAVDSVIAKGSDEIANCSNDTPIFNENNSGGANDTRK